MSRRSPLRKAKVGDDDQPLVPPSAILIDDPLETDLILGRGSAHAWRPANVAFHRLLDSYAPRYYATESTKKTKTTFIQEIYHQIAQRGRFLTKHGSSASSKEAPDVFVELSRQEAKARISDAMRYRQRRRKTNRSSTRVATAAVLAVSATAEAPSRAHQQRGPIHVSEKPEEPSTDRLPQQQAVANQPFVPAVATLHNPAVNRHHHHHQQQQQQDSPQVEIFSDNDLSSVLDHVEGFPGGRGR